MKHQQEREISWVVSKMAASDRIIYQNELDFSHKGVNYLISQWSILRGAKGQNRLTFCSNLVFVLMQTILNCNWQKAALVSNQLSYCLFKLQISCNWDWSQHPLKQSVSKLAFLNLEVIQFNVLSSFAMLDTSAPIQTLKLGNIVLREYLDG